MGGGKRVLGDIGFSKFATSNQNNWDESALRRVFNYIDTDGSNTIDIKELKNAFKMTNTHPTDKEVKAIFKAFDENKDGKISFNEFKSMVSAIRSNKFELDTHDKRF